MHIKCDYLHAVVGSLVVTLLRRPWRLSPICTLTSASVASQHRQPTLSLPTVSTTSGKPGVTHVHVNRTMSQTQTHTDSVDGQDHDEVQKKTKSRRPASKLTTSTPPKDL